MKITVLVADADGAQRYLQQEGPIARALKRLTGSPWAISAGRATNLKTCLCLSLPKDAVHLQDLFDQGFGWHAAQPVTFTLKRIS